MNTDPLRAGGQDIDLRPKTFEVLQHLVENAGRLVPKQELYQAVWANVCVSDDSLVQCIRELRQKLGDHEHSLIKTVPRRGYLLNTTLAPATAPSAWDGSALLESPRRTASRLCVLRRVRRTLLTHKWRVGGAAAGLLCIVLGVRFLPALFIHHGVDQLKAPVHADRNECRRRRLRHRLRREWPASAIEPRTKSAALLSDQGAHFGKRALLQQHRGRARRLVDGTKPDRFQAGPAGRRRGICRA